MGFKALVGVQRTSVQLPWANELIEQEPSSVGSVHDVLSIKLRPKGLIIECSKFGAWYFKSSNEYKFLIQYLEQWYESKQCNPVLQVQLTETAPYFQLGENDEQDTIAPWVLEDTVFYQSVKKKEALVELNLTLPKVPSSSELNNAREALDELAERKANQARQQTGKKKPSEEPLAGVVVRK